MYAYIWEKPHSLIVGNHTQLKSQLHFEHPNQLIILNNHAVSMVGSSPN